MTQTSCKEVKIYVFKLDTKTLQIENDTEMLCGDKKKIIFIKQRN